jgi:hypothetical protein
VDNVVSKETGASSGIPADDKAFCNAVSLKQSVGRGSRGCGQTAQQPQFMGTRPIEKNALSWICEVEKYSGHSLQAY